MKKIIFLLSIMTITATALFSQTSLNPRLLVGYNFSSTFIDKDYFKNNFLRGWNFGNSDTYTHKLDNALHINTYHTWAFWMNSVHSPTFNYNPSFITSLRHTMASYKGVLTTTGLGLYLEPSLEVSPSSTFVPNVEADFGAVYGFQSKSGGSNTIVSLGSSTFGCYHVPITSSGTILSNIWDGSILRYGNFVDDLKSTNQSETITPSATATRLVDKNGINWKLSINLRNSETFPEGLDDNTPVLRLRMPYKGVTTLGPDNSTTQTQMSGYIRFDSIPQVSSTFSNDVYDIQGSNTFVTSDFRGLTRNNKPVSLQNYFDVTVGMLRTVESLPASEPDNSSHRFITLGARFICDNEPLLGGFKNNPFFAPVSAAGSTFITSVDVEVEYFNNTLPVDINWVRIGTPNLEKVVNGVYDYLFLPDLDNGGEDVSKAFEDLTNNTVNAKIARLYSNDEMIKCEWEQFRYMNLLLDTLLTSEVFLKNEDVSTSHFYYSTGMKELWNGVTQSQHIKTVAPYVRLTKGNENPRTFCLWEGYATYLGRTTGANPTELTYIDRMLMDTTKSLYETIYHSAEFGGINTHLTPFSTSFSEILNPATNPRYSVQQQNELILLKTIHDQPYAFYEKPYISNVWIECTPKLNSSTFIDNASTPSMTYTKNQTKIVFNNYEKRPKTGEEQRYAFWSELIKGSKGLIVWAKPTHPSGSFTYPDENELTTYAAAGTFGYAGLFGSHVNSSSTFTEDEAIYSDAVGGDFIQLTNDPYGYDRFYTPYSNTFYDYKTMNIKKDRMYIGMKSARAELKKVFDWTKSVEPTLLKLNLIAYKNKGYVSFSNSKTISQTIDKFIDTANIKTRPLGRTSATTTGGITKYIPFFENQGCYPSDTFTYGSLASTPIDSAFYEVSILKNSGSSTENEFYLGVQNRRTDPLMTFSETFTVTGDPDPIKVDNSMKFYTTAELDKMASSTAPSYSYNTNSTNSGTVTSIVNGYSRTYTSPYPPEFWQQQWWQRLGCREIRIPINIAGLSNTNTMTMLKVTELGVGESIANEWWWDSKFRHNVDTAIYKDRDLVVRMLPGEGKILRVQVVRLNSGLDFVGHLDYPNQNKIVSFSSSHTMSMSDRSNPNQVRYHMVYQKYPGDPSTTFNQIYYRRSHPMTKDISGYTTAINWENDEHLLNAGIIDYSGSFTTCGGGTSSTRSAVPCFYPNLVVRVDSSVTPPIPKVYVVYSCYGSNDPTFNGNPKNVVIAESVFNANDNFQSVPLIGNVIAKALSDDYDQPNNFGITTINASYNGNYYAWTDKAKGIVAGFKKPGDQCLITTLQVTNNCSATFPNQNVRNPSMNTYSRIPYYDVDAALVWSSNMSSSFGGFGESRIGYTRLWYTPSSGTSSGTLSKSLASGICSTGVHSTFERDGCDPNIYYFSNLSYINSQEYPVVYRDVAFYNSATSSTYDPYRAKKIDHIYWQGKDWDNKSVIFNSTVSNLDNMGSSSTFYNQPYCISPIYSAHIRHEQWDLFSPTAAQGTLRKTINAGFDAGVDPSDPYGYEARTSDLDFLSGTSTTATIDNTIWHIPHGFQSLLYGWTYLLGNFDNYPLSMQTHTINVKFPHLSQQMTFSTDQEKKFNRRIYNEDYNSGTITTRKVSSSLEYFFKDNIDDNVQSGIGFFGFDNGKERSYFTGVILNRNGQSDNLKLNFLKDTENGKAIEDTITTNWFTISNNDEVNFIINNNDNSDRFKFYLQRKSDRKLIKLFKYQTKSELFKQGLIFKSDTTDTYRLIWHDSNLKTFTQELLLGNKAVMMKKERANPDFVTFVDLRNGTQIDSKSEEDLLLSIYPNPATNKFSIYTGLNRSMANHSRCKVEIKVINQLGLVLMSKIVPLGEVVTYDSEDLPSGQYFVQVETLEGFDGSCEHFMNVKPVSIVK